jgi:sugar phosphate permease
VFLVFVVPHSVASTTRRVVGGHIVGVIVEVAAFGILTLILDDPAEMSHQSFAIAGAISVGVAILLMALTNGTPAFSWHRAQPRSHRGHGWRDLQHHL